MWYTNSNMLLPERKTRMKKTTLKKYARLIVRVGANVQKGQPVLLYVAVDQHEFAVMVAEECYRAGASRVDMEWSCQPIAKLAYRHQSLKTLSKVPKWKEEKLKLADKANAKRRFFIRMKGNVEDLLSKIQYSFGDVEIIKVPELEDEFGFITPVMMEGDYDLRAASFKDEILHMIRIEN